MARTTKDTTPQVHICELPGCTKPCSVANSKTGAYHKHCCKEHRAEHFGLSGEGDSTACINLVALQSHDDHPLLRASAAIGRELAAYSGAIVIMDPSLQAPQQAPQSSAFLVDVLDVGDGHGDVLLPGQDYVAQLTTADL